MCVCVFNVCAIYLYMHVYNVCVTYIQSQTSKRNDDDDDGGGGKYDGRNKM